MFKKALHNDAKDCKQRLESLSSLFSKSYVCKMSSVLSETRSGRKFQNPQAGRAYVFEKLLFRDGSAWTVGLTV